MKWELISPSAGDMIRVKAGSIYHYGVFVSEQEVIQFGLAPIARQSVKDCDIEVCASDVDTFLHGGFLEVAVLDKKEARKRINPCRTVEIAKSKLGTRGYNILYNNCEHFAYECVFGQKKCTQTDDTRAMFKNLFASTFVMRVYTAAIPEPEISEQMLDSIHPLKRKEEILACSNSALRRQKYYAWRLLEHALEDTFGYKMQDLSISKNENGKWVCPSCYFSISHSENAVAVAVARCEVGVDIQCTDVSTPLDGFRKKILTPVEDADLLSLSPQDRNTFILTKWSQKESIFKSLDQRHFKPSTLNTGDYPTASKIITVQNCGYILSCCGKYAERLVYKQHEFGENTSKIPEE